MKSTKTSATFWDSCGNQFHRFLSPVQSTYCANCSWTPRSDHMTNSINFEVLHAQSVQLRKPPVDDCALKHTQSMHRVARSWCYSHCPQVHLLRLLAWISSCWETINTGEAVLEMSDLISLVFSIIWYQLLLLWKAQFSPHFLTRLFLFPYFWTGTLITLIW